MSGRFRWPWRSRPMIAAQVDEELDFHLTMRIAELEREGVAPALARQRAIDEFGDLEATRRSCRHDDQSSERARQWRDRLQDLVSDLHHVRRAAARSPGLATVAAATLAVAVAAAATVFALVDGVLFKSLPYREAERLVAVFQHESRKDAVERPSPANFLDWRERTTQADLAAAEPFGFDLLGSDTPIALGASLVSGGYFSVLGVEPLIGRDFAPEEFEPGKNRVVILSYSTWRRRFGGRPAIVGQTIQLDRTGYHVVGVLPPQIDYPDRSDLYAPKVFGPEERTWRNRTYYRVIGRLRPGATLGTLGDDLGRISRQLATEYPATNRNVSTRVIPVAEDVAGRVRPGLLLLLGAVGLATVVACLNVAGLLLTRAAYRRQEFAVRAALGAGRSRLVRLAAVEGAALAVIAGVVGYGLALLATRLTISLAPPDLPRLDNIAPDGRVVAVLAGLVLVTAMICTVAPAWLMATIDDTEVFRARGERGGRGALRTGRGLVVVEVALAVALLAAAGLLGKSFIRLVDRDLGYQTEGRMLATVHVWDRYPGPEHVSQFVDRVTAELAVTPGVRSTAVANALPLSAEGSEMDPPFLIEGQPVPPTGEEPTARVTIVSPGYFSTLGIPLRHGRILAATDHSRSPLVTVVNEEMARRHWPNENPIGRALLQLRRNGPPVRREIIGVVGDVRFGGHGDEVLPEYYVPLPQWYFASLTFVISGVEGDVTADAIQRAFTRADPSVVVSNFESLNGLLRQSLATRRFILSTTLAFAVLSVIVAGIGIYGLMTFLVTARSRELGIRLALGSDGRRLVGLIARQGLGLAALGAAGGIAGVVLARPLLATQVFGVPPTDFQILGVVVFGALAIGVGASLIPAMRAGRADPVEVLRRES